MQETYLRQEYEREECPGHLKSEQCDRGKNTRQQPCNADQDLPPSKKRNEPNKIGAADGALDEFARRTHAKRFQKPGPDEDGGD